MEITRISRYRIHYLVFYHMFHVKFHNAGCSAHLSDVLSRESVLSHALLGCRGRSSRLLCGISVEINADGRGSAAAPGQSIAGL